MVPTKAGLNRLLSQILTRDSDIDGFVNRCFPSLVRRIARGADGPAKIGILVENADTKVLLDKLTSLHGGLVAKNEHLLVEGKQVVGAELPEVGPLLGREDQLADLVAHALTDKPLPTLLTGPAGAGKTALVSGLLHAPTVVERFGGRRYLVHLDTVRDEQGVLVAISRALDTAPLAPLRLRIVEALRRAPAIVVLDDVDVAFANAPTIQNLLTELGGIAGVVIVMTSRAAEANVEGVRLVNISAPAAVSPSERTEAHQRILPLLAILPNGVGAEDGAVLPAAMDAAARAELRASSLVTNSGGRIRLRRAVREGVDIATVSEEDVVRATYHYTSIALAHGPKIGWPDSEASASRLAQDSDNIEEMILRGFSGPHRIAAIDAAVAIATFIGSSGHCTPKMVEKARESAKENGDKLGEAECTQALGDIALARHQSEEARKWFIEALPLFGQAHAGLSIAACLVRLGDLALERGDAEDARARFTAAIPVYRSILDKFGEGTVVKSLAELAAQQNDHAEARKQFQTALGLFEAVGEKNEATLCRKGIADAAFHSNEHEDARVIYEEIGPTLEEMGDHVAQAECLHNLGDIAFAKAQHPAATAFYQKELPLRKTLGDKLGEGACMAALGDVAMAASEIEDAQAYYHAALPLLRAADEKYGMANCIQSLGDIALTRMDQDTARDNYEQSLFLFTQLKDGYSLGWTHYRLAQVAGDPDVFKTHLADARSAWQSVGRDDLIKEMSDEFPGVLS